MRSFGLLMVAAMTTACCAQAQGNTGALLGRVDAAHSPFDLNGDGVAEIRWVKGLGVERAAAGEDRGLVLVLVEPRLLAAEAPALREALATYADDLGREGWGVSVRAMQVYDGPVHQDGRTLLAMREYLRSVKGAIPDFAGVVLVGSFPEGLLVRQYSWRQHEPTVLRQGQAGETNLGDQPVYRLRSVPENVSMRCDLMLADLDGKWENLYHAGPEALPWVMAAYPEAKPAEGASLDLWPAGGRTQFYELGTTTFEDFFFLNDGKFTVVEHGDGTADLTLQDDLQDDECSAADRAHPGNVMAHPDICVSRIDARHIALKPKASVRGVKGEGLLDARGLPQTVTFADEKATPHGIGVWEADPVLEQRLLVEFFERNHRYRRGDFRDQLRPATAAYGLDSPQSWLVGSRPQWQGFSEPGYEVAGEAADLAAVVEWLRRPAVLRDVCAHSDPWGSSFKDAEVGVLEAACGGPPWNWVRKGNRLVPSLGGSPGKLDFAITRTLWQNKTLPDEASFYLHHGCDIMAPGGGSDRPYSSPEYAYWQGAEGLLFYCQGLALVGRAKTFYDFPRDFAEEFAGAGKTFGEALAHYYDVESQAKDWEEVGGGIGRKRAYWWGILGDWTLRL